MSSVYLSSVNSVDSICHEPSSLTNVLVACHSVPLNVPLACVYVEVHFREYTKNTPGDVPFKHYHMEIFVACMGGVAPTWQFTIG